ncbi:MAG: hypothetical protein B6I26_02460 [Desulfobacteraceae bacterium 4572_130]|nr:MAG: hypothetical protein B6I26_02460 [Desulfobacteraceae bacterium 4572_130]
MLNIFFAIKRIFIIFAREKIHKIFIFAFLVLLIGSVFLVFFEKNISFFDGLWWSIVTMTTVGYGDISPITVGGRIVAFFVMISGIGLLGLLTATVAGMFVENKFMEKRGMKKINLANHFIICGWNFRGETIISEIKADLKSKHMPIVIIADINEKPSEEENVFFIHGQIDSNSLSRAHAKKAAAVIILADDLLDSYSRDAKTILNIMTIKNYNPNLYTCVELMSSKNIAHCKIAKADEIIVVGELSTNLLVQAALDHGITRLISELVSNHYGNDLYKIKIPSYLIGKSFFHAMCELKEKKDIICIGIKDKLSDKFFVNPNSNYVLKENDFIIIIGLERPDMMVS